MNRAKEDGNHRPATPIGREKSQQEPEPSACILGFSPEYARGRKLTDSSNGLELGLGLSLIVAEGSLSFVCSSRVRRGPREEEGGRNKRAIGFLAKRNTVGG